MTRSWNRRLAIAVGLGFALFGLLGIVVAPAGDAFAAPGGLILGVFEVNTAQNVLHLVMAAVLVGGAIAGAGWTKTANTVVGAACLVVGIVGLFVTGTPANILAMNVPDHVVHFGTSAVLLGAGLGADRHGADGPAMRHR